MSIRPLSGRMVAQHDLAGFCLVISSGGPGAKTRRLAPGAAHTHYCVSPVRILWDQYERWIGYLPAILRSLFGPTAKRQRSRDLAAVERVDCFIASLDYFGTRIFGFNR